MDELPPSIDRSRPSVARIYDWLLGGSANFAVDREAAQKVVAELTSMPLMARLNRSFLRRAVRYLVEQGIDQFLDLGSGIPTAGNVHEIAQAASPDARVVYVDVDPVAVNHARHLLADDPNATAVHADLRDVDTVLLEATTLLDFTRPIGLLLAAILPFIPDADDPSGIIDRYLSTLVPGSYLALSHGTNDQADNFGGALAAYNNSVMRVTLRSHAELLDLLHGVDLVEPGLVWTTEWRPDGRDPQLASGHEAGTWAAVGQLRKPTLPPPS
ncbi:MAG TPA: SAM-dependent methyltransferase [Pseudonocardiaceae bacterium]|jgi:hypothetical protein|nr:SAM-dependent methyltransferase [Pseudonocardiaceae bacterium]